MGILRPEDAPVDTVLPPFVVLKGADAGGRRNGHHGILDLHEPRELLPGLDAHHEADAAVGRGPDVLGANALLRLVVRGYEQPARLKTYVGSNSTI